MAGKKECCFLGRGKLGIACVDSSGSWGCEWGSGWGMNGAVLPPTKHIGNVSDISINIDSETKQLINLSTGFYENDCSVCVINEVTFSMNLNCVSAHNLKMALMGNITSTAAKGGVETHSVCPNSDVPFECGTFIPFNSPGVDCSSVSVSVSDDSIELVEGVHYTCDPFGIELLIGLQLMGGVTLDLEYSFSSDFHSIEALTERCKNVKMIFRGINLANEESFLAIFHNVRLNPTSAFNLISEDFTTLNITGTLEADTMITQPGRSKYFTIMKLGS